jgi:hypothetical protein
MRGFRGYFGEMLFVRDELFFRETISRATLFLGVLGSIPGARFSRDSIRGIVAAGERLVGR